MNKLIRKLSKGKNVLLLFILTNLVYVFMLAVSIPRVAAYANGMKLPDMLPTGYDMEYVQKLFTALGEEGRHLYLSVQLPIDMVYPLLFSLSYSFLLVWLLGKMGKEHSKLFYAAYLPFIAAAGDYLENLSLIKMLTRFPEISPKSVEITSFFSIVKSTTTTLYFMVLLVVLLLLFWSWIRKR